MTRQLAHRRVPTRTRLLATAAAATTAAALLAGCGGDEESSGEVGGQGAPAAASGEQADAVPPGFRLVTVSEHDFALALPKGWKTLPNGPAKLKKVLEENPNFNFDPAQASKIQYVALSPDPSGTNVNVVIIDTGAIPLSDFIDAYPAFLKDEIGATSVQAGLTETASGQGVRVSYRPGKDAFGSGAVPAQQIQYVIFQGGKQYVLTVTLFGKKTSAAVADQIGESLDVR
ncbi:MAG: hypothetical protein ACT4PP_00990 [Sporichthyaceae bacterium]